MSNGRNAVHAEVWDGHKSRGTESGGGSSGSGSSGCCSQDSEGVWGGGGGLLPLDGAVSLLSPDTVGVVLGGEELAVAVAVHGP